MIHAVDEIFGNALMITGFVFIMMLIIEYLNVFSRGKWDRVISRWRGGQSVLCAVLGASPGCLGAYAVASFYMHRIVSLGALTACMVATSGDEAFVMLALFPEKALLLFSILCATGIVVGLLTDVVLKSHRSRAALTFEKYKPSHGESADCVTFSAAGLAQQWRNCSPQRGWLSLFLILFIAGILSGTIRHQHVSLSPRVDDVLELVDHDDHEARAHQHSEAVHSEEHGWDWLKTTFLALSLIALFVVVTVPDHFLDEHLWNHLAKVHAWRIFLWTTGALLFTHVLVHFMDVRTLVAHHALPLLLIACLAGVMPESGPHLIFVALFAEGTIPFSVLLASSIVQDGHGMLPVLSHSRRAFAGIKAAKLVVGLLVGLLGHLMGW